LKGHSAVVLLVVLACSCAPLADAHDFWLQPNEFWASQDALIQLTLQVGHGPFRQRSPIPARRIRQFHAIAADGAVVDLQSRLRLGLIAEDGDFQLASSGTYVLVLQTDDQAQTHLPSIRFNDYLRVEGLTLAWEQRARLHRLETDGSERYSRCAKSLMQIGPPRIGSKNHVNEPVGLPLEIVPEVNPYSVPQSSTLPVHVIYAGHPLAAALVKMTDLRHDASPFETHLTDRNGHATFTMPRSGTWLLNVIWTRALPPSQDVDFETVFSSLSFGFPSEF
jgi:uncharacterized GH25 family protein